jgi:hypothetical protein
MIIQNFLPSILEENLYNNLISSNFPWYWNDFVLYDDKEKQKNLFQFTHTFIKNGEFISSWVNLTIPIVYFLEKQLNTKIKSIYKLKANLTTKTIINESDIKELYHIDKETSNYISFIYYVEDSDGDTIIENKSFTPKRNSLVWFKSNITHAGMFPKINKRRIIINGVLEI